MLFASENAPKRANYNYEHAPNGNLIGWKNNARPSINKKHIDGPLLYMRNGELHWLTLWERLLLWLGNTDAEALERKYRPHLSDS